MKNNKISPGEGRVQEQGGLSSNITFCGRDSFQCNQTGCTVISGDSLMKPAGWKWWWHEWRRVLLASHSQVVTPNTQCGDSQSSWGRPGGFLQNWVQTQQHSLYQHTGRISAALVRDGHDSHVTVQTLDSWQEVLGETCYLCLTLWWCMLWYRTCQDSVQTSYSWWGFDN